MPRWRAERRGRSRHERQGPAIRARPSNRAGLAKSRPCAFRRAIPLISGGDKEEGKYGRTPAPGKKQGPADHCLSAPLSSRPRAKAREAGPHHSAIGGTQSMVPVCEGDEREPCVQAGPSTRQQISTLLAPARISNPYTVSL